MKVLIAEDDDSIREVVSIIVTQEGHTFLEASDKSTALALASRERPDIIFMDISLGLADGSEIVKELKKKQSTQEIPMIIMSANPKTESIAAQSGADGFLLKPFDMENFISILMRYA